MTLALAFVGFLILVMIAGLVAMTRPQHGARRMRCQVCHRRRATQGVLCGTCQSTQLIRFDG